jgi:L-Ala-D/L-Glu epimerase
MHPEINPADVRLVRVERDEILGFRHGALGGGDTPASALARDMSPATRHWAAMCGDTMVGCVSVMRARGYALRGMAVAAVHRDRGIGSRMLDAVCVAVGGPMWCNARLDAAGFYAKRGWVAVGPVFDIEGRGAHQRMTWTPAPAPTRGRR